MKTSTMPHVQAVLFDAYGTLFDVYSVGTLAEQLFPGRGEALAVLWRDKQIEYTRLVSMSQRFRPFWELTRASLRFAAARLGLELSAEHEAQLLNQYRHLGAFPENKAVLTALKARGIPTGILSNGDPDMLSVAVKSAGIDTLLDHVLSVDAVRKYKTHPEAYRLGTQALKKPAKRARYVRHGAPADALPGSCDGCAAGNPAAAADQEA